MSTLVVQERNFWLCLVDIGTLTKFSSPRFLYPRLASSAMQPVTWPSSSRLHRSRLRRSKTSCLGRQLLPPPFRWLQHPACSSPRAPPCVHPRSCTTSAAAFKSGAVELCVAGRPARPGPRQLAVSGGARGLGTGDPEREGTASGEGKCISPSPGGGPGG